MERRRIVLREVMIMEIQKVIRTKILKTTMTKEKASCLTTIVNQNTTSKRRRIEQETYLLRLSKDAQM